MINKVVKNAEEALHDIPDNAVLMVGGFGLCGIPENSLKELPSWAIRWFLIS